MPIKLIVNGQARELDVDPDMPLLWAIRDHLQLTGTKFGCGMALCGACTVHIDGQATRSCMTPVATAQTDHDYRGSVHARRTRRAASVDCPERAAVRLLPERSAHVGGRAAGVESA